LEDQKAVQFMNETLNALMPPIRLGGHISLDFANTFAERRPVPIGDYFQSYDHLLAWCWHNGQVDDSHAEHCYTVAQKRLEEAQATLEYALDVRETIYGVFSTWLEHGMLQRSDLNGLNTILARLLPHRCLDISDNGCVWAWDGEHLELILLPIVMAATDLLTSEQIEQVRQCPNCGWLFLDTSRNHSRRWCSMDFCGSKMKSRRQYERKRSQ
jgi:predicted RNA-binding Zn ribbon-like protein